MTLSLPQPDVANSSGVSQAAYNFIAQLIYERSRIRLTKEKKALVAARLASRRRELGLQDLDEYCERLRSSDDEEEVGRLVDLISTNHTQFFREFEHFRFLRKTVLPKWAARAGAAPEPLRVWSAACSSGEEPYSISILLAEHYLAEPQRRWSIEASDISKRMLREARAGIYAADKIKMPTPEWLPRYFQEGTGRYQGYCRVKPVIQEKVSFHQLNLFQPRYAFAPGFHVIFCRNVMIYFDRESQAQLVQRLVQCLAPGGYLMIGHSESLVGIQHGLKYVQPSVYQFSGTRHE